MVRWFAICLLFFILYGCSDAIHGKRSAPDAQDTEPTLSLLDAGPTSDRSTPFSSDEAPTHNLDDGGTSNEAPHDKDPSDVQSPEETEWFTGPDLANPPEPRAVKEVVQENMDKPEPKEPTEPREPPKSNMGQSGFRILHWNIAGGKALQRLRRAHLTRDRRRTVPKGWQD
ncbi:MAG: hypothetical protein EP343_08435 [Deltaproteobacteria bacterium]|nr:MAG: hypothetical protein EP343_08435 [Deltaproteobacteria bacterium]